MKKIIILSILVCAVAAFAFSESFTVQNVTGRVEREAGNQRVEVKTGDTVDGEAVLHTGVGASVVLRDQSGKTTTVSAARNGKVVELVKASTGVRIGGNVARTNTGVVNRTTVQAGTASARASDAAGDDNIAAE